MVLALSCPDRLTALRTCVTIVVPKQSSTGPSTGFGVIAPGRQGISPRANSIRFTGAPTTIVRSASAFLLPCVVVHFCLSGAEPAIRVFSGRSICRCLSYPDSGRNPDSPWRYTVMNMGPVGWFTFDHDESALRGAPQRVGEPRFQYWKADGAPQVRVAGAFRVRPWPGPNSPPHEKA